MIGGKSLLNAIGKANKTKEFSKFRSPPPKKCHCHERKPMNESPILITSSQHHFEPERTPINEAQRFCKLHINS